MPAQGAINFVEPTIANIHMESLMSDFDLEHTVELLRELSANNQLPAPALLLQYVMDSGSKTRIKDIGRHFAADNGSLLSGIRDRLDLLKEIGMLDSSDNDEYQIPKNLTLTEGVVAIASKDLGAVILEGKEGEHPLTRKQMRRVVHGDRVLCMICRMKQSERIRVEIMGVLKRRVRSVVGEFRVLAKRTLVIPLNDKIIRTVEVKPDQENAFRDGDVVKTVLTSPPFAPGGLSGKIIECLGKAADPKCRITMAMHQYDIPYGWSDDVQNEIEHCRVNDQPPTPDSWRKDLRDLPFITIDGPDAKDFDDAVYCCRDHSGWRLIVAIADVSDCVKTGSAMDREAYQRGTSIYFPDRVVPMLPEFLSNGICSLSPHQDRNSLVCDMHIDRRCRISDYVFYQAVIKSKARMTYEMVERFLERQDDANLAEDSWLVDRIRDLESVASGLESKRMANGSITFDFPEAQIDLTDDGQILSIGVRERLRAHKVIEECMLAANCCAAEFMNKKSGNGALYRVHPGPVGKDIMELRQDLRVLGIELEGGKQPMPADFQRLLKGIENNGQLFDAVQILLLQKMGRAVYSSQLADHFALGFSEYTHFTSPIRRYSDLVVHRLIKKLIGIPSYVEQSLSIMNLEQTSRQCSMTERRADAAVYAVIAWLKAMYMLRHIGKRFSGVVTGVKEFGLFIRLDELMVDGLAHVSKLGLDYFRFDEVKQTLCGEFSGDTYRLGERVEAAVLDVDLAESRVNFSLLDDHDLHAPKFHRKRRRRFKN